MANETKTKTAEGKGKPRAWHIAARTDGFRRCGRAWPASGVTIDADEIPADVLEILKGERELVVTEVTG